MILYEWLWSIKLNKLNEAKKGKRKMNPWAICHSSTGPKKSAKFERCVMHVKSQYGIKK